MEGLPRPPPRLLTLLPFHAHWKYSGCSQWSQNPNFWESGKIVFHDLCILVICRLLGDGWWLNPMLTSILDDLLTKVRCALFIKSKKLVIKKKLHNQVSLPWNLYWSIYFPCKFTLKKMNFKKDNMQFPTYVREALAVSKTERFDNSCIALAGSMTISRTDASWFSALFDEEWLKHALNFELSCHHCWSRFSSF